MSAARHAVYFAPAVDHPLWRAGCAWLGRDVDGRGAEAPTRAHVAAPWRYGFHATLKAPMRLVHGATDEAWREALHRLAAARRRFAMPRLVVDRLGDFLALRPQAELPSTHPLQRLADDCVAGLDAWRAAPDAAERERWQRAGLAPRERDQALRYGYPYVFESWRFHMTLSDAVAAGSPGAMERLQREAESHFAEALTVPLACDALCWFVEPAPGAPFELRERVPLA